MKTTQGFYNLQWLNPPKIKRILQNKYDYQHWFNLQNPDAMNLLTEHLRIFSTQSQKDIKQALAMVLKEPDRTDNVGLLTHNHKTYIRFWEPFKFNMLLAVELNDA